MGFVDDLGKLLAYSGKDESPKSAEFKENVRLLYEQYRKGEMRQKEAMEVEEKPAAVAPKAAKKARKN